LALPPCTVGKQVRIHFPSHQRDHAPCTFKGMHSVRLSDLFPLSTFAPQNPANILGRFRLCSLSRTAVILPPPSFGCELPRHDRVPLHHSAHTFFQSGVSGFLFAPYFSLTVIPHLSFGVLSPRLRLHEPSLLLPAMNYEVLPASLNFPFSRNFHYACVVVPGRRIHTAGFMTFPGSPPSAFSHSIFFLSLFTCMKGPSLSFSPPVLCPFFETFYPPPSWD